MARTFLLRKSRDARTLLLGMATRPPFPPCMCRWGVFSVLCLVCVCEGQWGRTLRVRRRARGVCHGRSLTPAWARAAMERHRERSVVPEMGIYTISIYHYTDAAPQL